MRAILLDLIAGLRYLRHKGILRRAWRSPRIALGVGTAIDPEAQIMLPDDVTIGPLVSIGDGAYVGPYVLIGPSAQGITIGQETSINSHCDILGTVTIGRYCTLASHIYMSSGRHHFRLKPAALIRDQDALARQTPALQAKHDQPVVIDEDVWVGRGVYIAAGVHIGRGAVIGANAVVLGDVPPYAVYGGVPASKISERLLFAPPIAVSASVESDGAYFYEGFTCLNGAREFRGRAKIVLSPRPAREIVVQGSCPSDGIRLSFGLVGCILATQLLARGDFTLRHTIDAAQDNGESWRMLRLEIPPDAAPVAIANVELVF